MFVCPVCDVVNRAPRDVAEQYCGWCHWYTGDPEIGHANPHPPAPPPAHMTATGSALNL